MVYVVEEYVAGDGTTPFRDWLLGLKDGRVRGKLTARIARASHGNFGDCKSIKNAAGLFEMREHSGAGYRIYYSVVGRKVLLLLAGSAKQVQRSKIRTKRSPSQNRGFPTII